jgi:hypothetical protein
MNTSSTNKPPSFCHPWLGEWDNQVLYESSGSKQCCGVSVQCVRRRSTHTKAAKLRTAYSHMQARHSLFPLGKTRRDTYRENIRYNAASCCWINAYTNNCSSKQMPLQYTHRNTRTAEHTLTGNTPARAACRRQIEKVHTTTMLTHSRPLLQDTC